MANYIPVIVWTVGALLSYAVLRKRGVKVSLPWNIALAIAGPLAIPFAFIVRPKKADTAH